MKYAIDKQFGLWRHMKQPVMGGTMHGYDQVDCEISRENINKRINWLSQTIR